MGDFNRDGGSGRGRSGGFRGRDSDRGGRSGGFRGRDSDRGRSGGFDRGEGGRDRHSERHEMHSAICDKCGKDCEVPFKPTQGKPIYCSDCFKDKSREAGSRSEFGRPSGNQSNVNFDQINEKLNKILKILGATKGLVEEKEQPELKKTKKKKEKTRDLEESKSTETDTEKELPDLEEPKSIEEEQPKLEYAKSEEIEKPKKKKAKKNKS